MLMTDDQLHYVVSEKVKVVVGVLCLCPQVIMIGDINMEHHGAHLTDVLQATASTS